MDYSLEDEEFRDGIIIVAAVIVVLPVILYVVFGDTVVELFSIALGKEIVDGESDS